MPNSQLRPGKLSRANAYAASAAVTVSRIVVPAAKYTVFSRYLPSGTRSNARVRFSGCQLLGQKDGFAAIDSTSDWKATSTIITTGIRVRAVTRKQVKTTSLRRRSEVRSVVIVHQPPLEHELGGGDQDDEREQDQRLRRGVPLVVVLETSAVDVHDQGRGARARSAVRHDQRLVEHLERADHRGDDDEEERGRQHRQGDVAEAVPR